MTIQPDLFAQAVLAVWLLGFIHLWDETAPRERYIDMTREEEEMLRYMEWLSD